MRIVTVSEVLALEAGENIPAIRAKLTKLYERMSGTAENGKEWSIQNGELEDSTGKIKVMFSHRDEVPMTMKGKVLMISCQHGDKGLSGVKAEDDTYRNKVSRIVKVTPTGLVELYQSDAAEPPQPPQRPAPTAPVSAPVAPPTPSPKAPSAAPAPASAPQPPAAPVRNITANAKNRCRDYYCVMVAVHEMAEAWSKQHPDFPMTDEQIQAARATVYIQMQRDGVL